MEIKNKLSDQSGVGMKLIRERRGKGKQRNTNRGLMGKGNGGEFDCGGAGDGLGESNGQKGRTAITERQ